ncbi:MAG: hypothetical protein AMS21_06730 [Gemmatimonas sp. SG8_38_2]|nr:MAG: hypothetical protein AMS21_06730 [Gemmatimonas sp. SG8_38_2]
MSKWKVWAAVLALALVGVTGVVAEERELDPLLELLVEQGVITMEQALAVQAEYDRRGKEGQATEAPAAATDTPPPATAKAGPAPAAVYAEEGQAIPDSLLGVRDLKIGSLVYLSGQQGNTSDGDDYAQFKIKRGYIDIRKKITPYFSARITPDVHQDETGDLKVRLKYAYGLFTWDWKGLVQKPYVEWGVAHMPWLDFEEHINLFRMQDTMFMERNGLFNSADMGVLFGGNLGHEMPDDFKKNVQSHYAGRWGSFGVGIYNGGGYHAEEKNTNKALEGRLTIRPVPDIVPGLQVSAFGITGEGNQSDVPGESIPDMQVLAAMVSYESKRLVATAQYERGEGNQKGSAVDADGNALPHEGYSLYTEIRLDAKKRFSLIGRYDWFDTDRNDPSADVKKRYIAGFAWQFHKGSYWLLDYDRLEHSVPGLETEDRVQLTLQVKY